MDYILSKIRTKKEYYHNMGEDQQSQHSLYCRVEIEYVLHFMLGYLWNKNVTSPKLDTDTHKWIRRKLYRPSLGTIVEICKDIDLDNEFFSQRRNRANKNARRSLYEYVQLRNDSSGHGYTFEDGIKDLIEELERLSIGLFESESTFSHMLLTEFEIILVTQVSGNIAKGWKYRTNQQSEFWTCNTDTVKFEPDNVYAMRGVNDYIRLSPFIFATDEDFYIFRTISNERTGRTALYNRLFKTGTTSRDWSDFSGNISEDENVRESTNGTIRNHYENNFESIGEYIDMGPIKKDIESFLTRDRASVCGTVWGHGGVGKTATVQSICEDLSSLPQERIFDYIVFASAKNREFQLTTGEIKKKDDPINSYQNLVRCINTTIDADAQNMDKVCEIVNFKKGKLLIIIDDYETFSATDREQIEALIDRMDIDKHKVLITTRAFVTKGKEFATHELNKQETVKFLRKVMALSYPDSNLLRNNNTLNDPNDPNDPLNDPKNQQDIFARTTGRPLFIFHFAHVLVQEGDLEKTFEHKINNTKEAIDFLFGRVFDCLSPIGQDIFCAIGRLVNPPELTNLVERLRYIVNMESVYEADSFSKGLRELKTLRIIEEGNDLFRVYSTEIWDIMSQKYSSRFELNDKSRDQLWCEKLEERLAQAPGDQNVSIGEALLNNANALRHAGVPPEEVSESYRRIIERTLCPQHIRSQALLNQAEYFSKGNMPKAIQIFDKYWKWEEFKTDPLVTRRYAEYYWSNRNMNKKNMDKAVSVLWDFISLMRDQKQDPGFGILGQCLTYQSIMLVERKEDLKKQRSVDREITQENFEKLTQNVINDLENLSSTLGNSVFQKVKKSNLEELTPDERQQIAIGLYQFSGVCFRRFKFELAIDICEFLLENREFRAQININGCERRINDASFQLWDQPYKRRNRAMSEAFRKAGY